MNSLQRQASSTMFNSRFGVRAAGGILSHRDAHLVPDQFVKQLAEHAAGNGVQLTPSVELIGFETSGRRVTRVHTTRGHISGEEVVLAGGSWT